jgi:hypothetical protein
MCLLGIDDVSVYAWEGSQEELHLKLGVAVLAAISAGEPSAKRFGETEPGVQLVDVAVDEATGPVSIWMWSVGDSTYMNQLSDDMLATFKSIASDVIRGRPQP